MYSPTAPHGSTVFRNDVCSILNEAEKVAREILSPRSLTHNGFGLQRNSFGDARLSPPLWPTHHMPVINTTRCSAKERDRNDRTLLGLTFFALAAVTTCLVRRDMGMIKKAKGALRQGNKAQLRFSNFKEAAYNHPHANIVKKIQATQQRIFENTRTKAETGVYLKGGLLSSCTIGALGSIFGGTIGWALIPLAIAGGVISGVFILVRISYDNTTKCNQQEAHNLLYDIQGLKRLRDGDQQRIPEPHIC
ncbi:hypothetical protein SCG7086_AQ_00160 [Chlamydiales bacterium SCGC AG-110-P3]|nr:hypothetical protein SCG7086_AQ_00160 [Chlamydiales bacterium SCGC AG-110-P3]